jgi:dCMP deaminase
LSIAPGFTARGLPTWRVVAQGHASPVALTLREHRDNLEHAHFHAARSTCPKAKVGCLIVSPDLKRTVYGWNGAPAGVATCHEAGCVLIPATEASREYSRHLHAEARAIAHAALDGLATRGATLYVTIPPCLDCARLICVAGIALIVTTDLTDEWFDAIGAYLDAGGVKILELRPE